MPILIVLISVSRPLTAAVIWLLGQLCPEAAQTGWRLWRTRTLSRRDSQAGGDVSASG